MTAVSAISLILFLLHPKIEINSNLKKYIIIVISDIRHKRAVTIRTYQNPELKMESFLNLG